MRATATVHARAALAGNPSDGFDGAVCAVRVPFLAATATVTSSSGAGAANDLPLVRAALDRYRVDVGDFGEVEVDVETSIPRSVGLAGSSAIVTAVLRALDELTTTGSLSPMQIARLAHRAERLDLGIAGGWQDQLVQSHGVSALVECNEPLRVTPLSAPPDPIPLYLAWSPGAGESSGRAHAQLRASTGRPTCTGSAEESNADSRLAKTMQELASLARVAANAYEDRNIHQLKETIDATIGLRREIMDLNPAHSDMVDIAHGLGASANFAGSGGAIVGVLPKNGSTFTQRLVDAGYQVRTWDAQ